MSTEGYGAKRTGGSPGFLQRVMVFFGLREKKKHYSLSRFYHHLEGLSKKTAEYGNARKAVSLCDEAVSIVTQRVSLIEQLKSAERTLLEYKAYENISDEEAKGLKELISRLRSLSRDKSELKGQIAAFDPALERMAELELDAEAIAPEMKDAERNQRLFRQDINYLRGEKSDLESERETLIRGERFIRRFMTAVLVFFVLCVTIMSFSAIITSTTIAVPLSIMTLIVTVVTALLYGFRQRLKYEMDMNLKKQKKAVGMLNTKNAVFAHYTNFLNFTYKKYRVRNADMLKKRLKEYDHYRHITRRYDALRKLSDETERDLNGLLFKLKIPVQAMPVDDFARVFNLDEKRDIIKNAQSRKISAEQSLRLLDERQSRIWDQLTALSRVPGGIVEQIVSEYIEEAGKIILNPAYQTDMPETVTEAGE